MYWLFMWNVLLMRLILSVSAGVVMMVFWSVDVSNVGMLNFMLGWVIGLIILTDAIPYIAKKMAD